MEHTHKTGDRHDFPPVEWVEHEVWIFCRNKESLADRHRRENLRTCRGVCREHADSRTSAQVVVRSACHSNMAGAGKPNFLPCTLISSDIGNDGCFI